MLYAIGLVVSDQWSVVGGRGVLDTSLIHRIYPLPLEGDAIEKPKYQQVESLCYASLNP